MDLSELEFGLYKGIKGNTIYPGKINGWWRQVAYSRNLLFGGAIHDSKCLEEWCMVASQVLEEIDD